MGLKKKKTIPSQLFFLALVGNSLKGRSYTAVLLYQKKEPFVTRYSIKIKIIAWYYTLFAPFHPPQHVDTCGSFTPQFQTLCQISQILFLKKNKNRWRSVDDILLVTDLLTKKKNYLLPIKIAFYRSKNNNVHWNIPLNQLRYNLTYKKHDMWLEIRLKS